jgi:hypothetical protein
MNPGAALRVGGVFDFELWATREVSFFDRIKEVGLKKAWHERCEHFHKGYGFLGALKRRLKVWMPARIKTHLKDKWQEKNIVVNEGLNHILDVLFTGAGETQIDPWYCGLLAASPTPLATWTSTEIATNDFVDYDETNLQAYVDVRAGQSVSNTASKAAFSINQDTSSIGGAFLIASNAKASPSGIVLCAVAFTGGNKAADDGDTLNVTYTFTAADDGA